LADGKTALLAAQRVWSPILLEPELMAGPPHLDTAPGVVGSSTQARLAGEQRPNQLEPECSDPVDMTLADTRKESAQMLLDSFPLALDFLLMSSPPVPTATPGDW
jgi:hypothetical protein